MNTDAHESIYEDTISLGQVWNDPSKSSIGKDAHQPDLHSFPTRRSSDLGAVGTDAREWSLRQLIDRVDQPADRKSTRLNSSYITTSYAVFCLKKKTHDRSPSADCALLAAERALDRRQHAALGLTTRRRVR